MPELELLRAATLCAGIFAIATLLVVYQLRRIADALRSLSGRQPLQPLRPLPDSSGTRRSLSADAADGYDTNADIGEPR